MPEVYASGPPPTHPRPTNKDEVMDLVVDVGNSETVIGLTNGKPPEVNTSWRISTSVPRTADEFRLLLRGLVEESGV